MRNWKATLPIFLSLIIAGGGSYFIYRWMESRTAPAATVQVEQVAAVPVMTAAVDLAWGTRLTAEMLKTLPFFNESLPAGYYSHPTDLDGRVLVANLKQGDPVVEHRLAPVDVKTGGVSAVLAPGKRAVAVKGDKVIGISGFINPGNRVDVLATMKDPDSKGERTKIVLENITVLATGTQIEQNSKGQPSPVDVYTLEVTPLESEKLALAASRGKLQFALRNITDGEEVRTYGATIGQTLRSLRPPPDAPPPVEKKPKKKYYPPTSTTVEVIKGGQVTKQKVKL